MYAGVLLMAYPALTFVGGRGFQAYQDWAYFNSSASVPEAPKRAAPNPQAILGRLEIPRLKLSVMVLEGVDEPELMLGAGHVPGTALPGPTGNVGIAGHRDTYFRALRDIRPSDQIRFSTRDGVYHYVVESTKVTDPSDVGVLSRSDTGRLTLVTCYPFTFLGSAPERFIVQARLVDAAS
jgi:sortase A